MQNYLQRKEKGLAGLDKLKATEEVLLSYMQYDPEIKDKKVIVGNKTVITTELIETGRTKANEQLTQATKVYNDAIASFDELEKDSDALRAVVE